jgi:hypothetical protein
MPTYNTPKRATAFKLYVGLVDQANTKLLKANPTIAAGDFQVSKDGGAFANLTTLPSANPASGRSVMIDLSAAEMTADNVVIQCVDAAGAEWCDLFVNLQTTARQIDDLAYPATTGRSLLVDASGAVPITTNLKKNQALANFAFLMTDSTNHNPATGKTVSVTRCIDGGTFAAGTLSAVTEVSNGQYRVDFAAADLNGNVVTLRATASGCDDLFTTLILEP